MKSIAITEFKARCLALLDDVARTGQALIVTKRGKPLARIVATTGASVEYPQTTLRGTVEIRGDVLAPVVPRATWNAIRGVLVSQDDAKAKRKSRP